MITVLCDDDSFSYDIHSLTKAFFPDDDVKVMEKGAFFSDNNYDGNIFPDYIVEVGESAVKITTGRGEVRAEKEYGEEYGDADSSHRLHVKNVIKRTLYHVLSDDTGQVLPWGALTGIRPTRIALRGLLRGDDGDAIRRQMKNEYLAGEEKTELSLDIAGRELRILNDLFPGELSGGYYPEAYSLYVGIPFCPTTCMYCSFTSYPISAYRKRVGDYLDALEREMEAVSAMFRQTGGEIRERTGKRLHSVYVGGGTPTSLEPEELDRLCSSIKRYFPLEEAGEFCVEAGRPDSINGEKLSVLKDHGVNRISINPQSMNQETLDLIGRRHSVEQIRHAFRLAREHGFDNINMDIILGLPGEDIEHIERTLEAVKELAPESLTVHSLSVKRASKLGEMVREHQDIIRWKNRTRFMGEAVKLAEHYARDMGMKPYYLYRQKNISGNFENVGYAKEGFHGLYNILMMEDLETVAALGAGSITKTIDAQGNTGRCENLKNVDQYIDRIDEMIDRKRKLFL